MANAAVRAAKLEAHEPHFKVVHLVYLLIFAAAMMAFSIGRNVLTKVESEAVYVRKDLYDREQGFIRGEVTATNAKLTRMEDKIDRLVEAVHARP